MVFGIIMLIKGNESFVIRGDVSMAVTGVNNYSNIYTNAYTGNIWKNNAKETTEKQVVEQTEDVKTGTTRKNAADELSYLSKKFDNYSFISANNAHVR